MIRFDGLRRLRISDTAEELSGTLTGPLGLVRVSIVDVAGVYVLKLPIRLGETPLLNGEPAVLVLGVVEHRSDTSRYAAPFRYVPAGHDSDAVRFAESIFPPMSGGALLQIRLGFEQGHVVTSQVVTIGKGET